MKNRRVTAIATALLLLLISVFSAQFQQKTAANLTERGSIALSPDRIKHILYGDKTGGGHRHGQHKPCKSEFPENWSDQKIIDTVSKIASNDNTNWNRQDNGYFVTNTKIENLKIRVVVNSDKTQVITAYPTNVPRNPCTAANDNDP
ncbi:MAG: EndoU domain-containing protein [Alphaproteobacteria bacterium]|nr:EndoU domain-containing protein [Alphaproteobacteria bacterium]